MAELILLLYVAYLVGLGAAWLRFLAGQPQWQGVHLFWSFCLGTIVWAYTHFLLNLFNISTEGIRLYLWQVMLVALPVAGGRILPGRRCFGGEENGRREGKRLNHWSNSVAVVLIAIAVLTAALQALAFPMHMWDSIVIYGFKAKILMHEQTFKSPAFLDPSVLHYSTDYPLLVPYVEAGYYRWLGHIDDRVVRLIFLAYWISWLGIIYEALAARLRREYARLWVAFLATLPVFSNIFMGQAVSGFADTPFGLYWTGFLICGLGISPHGFEAPSLLTPLLALGCAFTKNEGIPAVAIGWGLFMTQASPQRRRLWMRYWGAAVLLLLPWGWVRYQLPHNSAHQAKILDLPIGQTFARLKLITTSFWEEIMGIKRWGLFSLLALAGLFWPSRSIPFPRESKILLMAIGLQATVYAYVYLIYSGNLDLLVPVTLPRLILHGIGPLVLALGWRFGEPQKL